MFRQLRSSTRSRINARNALCFVCLTRCLREEAAAIAAAAERLDADQVERALALLEQCANRKAKLVITGVGKSGIVARKIAATFSSIGLMALYLNPLDALHGDLGVVAPDDVTCCSLTAERQASSWKCCPPQTPWHCTDRPGGRAESSLAGGDVMLKPPSTVRSALQPCPDRQHGSQPSAMPWPPYGWNSVGSPC